MDYAYRHTKVIFTIGPATNGEEVLEQLIRHGVDICRLNMAHASHDWTRETVSRVREVCAKVGRQIAFMMDVKGPEIRTGPVDEPFQLERDDLFDFYTTAEAQATDGVPGVKVNYPKIAEDVKPGDTLLVDSGLIRMRIEAIHPDRVRCNVRIGGEIGSRRHINLPGVHVKLPALTEKDGKDIAVGLELGIEFYALSFVRSPDDLDILRSYLRERGSNARIIAKIEDQTAVTNLEDIIRASDGLMIARGDLGIEIPYETLPIVQTRALDACHRIGRPVIVATHMLESMITQPMPTRAEITDVATAVTAQADCVMLSGETTVGKYPVECVDVFNRISKSVEDLDGPAYNVNLRLKSPKEHLLRSAVTLADDLRDSAIVVFTRSGHLARTLSALRPRRRPIYGFTDVQDTFAQMLILWGVEPFLMDFSDDTDTTIFNAFARLKERNWVHDGQRIVLISSLRSADRYVDSIQIREVD